MSTLSEYSVGVRLIRQYTDWIFSQC